MADVKRLTKLVDVETGEILHDEVENVTLYLFTKRGYLLNHKEPYVKIWRKVEWPISNNDLGRLCSLFSYINEHNAFMRKDRPNRPLTIPLMAPIVDLSLKRTYDWVKRMTDEGILRKDDSIFYGNPLYFMASSRVSPELYRVWRDVLDPHIPEWAQKRYKEMMSQ